MKPHLALLAATLIYGLFYVATKCILVELGPWDTFTLRLLLATPLFFLLEKRFLNHPIQNWQDRVKITLLGLWGISAVQITLVMGMTQTSVFHTGFIVGLAPLMTLLLAVALGQERMTLPRLAGMGVALYGLYLLLSAKSGHHALPSTYLWGDLWVVINIFAWSSFIVLSRPLLSRYPAFSLTSHAFVGAGLWTLPVMLIWHPHWPGTGLSPAGWGWMAFIILFATLSSYFLNLFALTRLPASTVSVYVFVQPILSALFAHWVLGEPITMGMALDGLVILVGVGIATGCFVALAKLLTQGSGPRGPVRDLSPVPETSQDGVP